MVGKPLPEKFYWGILSELHGDWETHLTGHLMQPICNAWPILQHFYCAGKPSFLDWWNVTMIQLKIKNQIGKFSEAFNLPWPKTLPTVLLSLRFTLLGKHSLSPYKIVTYLPMHLNRGEYIPWLLKRDILNCY